MTDGFSLSPADREKLARLARIKRIALAALLACLASYIGLRLASSQFPQWAMPLGFAAAFFEAATIGGLADWYAVVVLFRHPLGLKLPHTAIIPANQDRIADNLGGFLQQHFLSPQTVGEKLKELDFAAAVTGWLGERGNSDAISRFAVRLLPEILAAVDTSGFKSFATRQIKRQVQKTEIAPVATTLIDAFVKDGRYQELIDEIIRALNRVIHDKDTVKSIQKRVAEELPTLLYVFQADSVIIRRIVKASTELLRDVQEQEDHPLRLEFQRLFEDYVEQMKTSRRFARRVERLKQEILSRPEITTLADNLWGNLVSYTEGEQQRENPVLSGQISGLLGKFASHIDRDENLRQEINSGLAAMLATVVEQQKPAVAGFVSQQVKSWDLRLLVTLVEANVGRDLQFIRFNGMVIGGIAGVVLHLIDVAL